MARETIERIAEAFTDLHPSSSKLFYISTSLLVFLSPLSSTLDDGLDLSAWSRSRFSRPFSSAANNGIQPLPPILDRIRPAQLLHLRHESYGSSLLPAPLHWRIASTTLRQCTQSRTTPKFPRKKVQPLRPWTPLSLTLPPQRAIPTPGNSRCEGESANRSHQFPCFRYGDRPLVSRKPLPVETQVRRPDLALHVRRQASS